MIKKGKPLHCNVEIRKSVIWKLKHPRIVCVHCNAVFKNQEPRFLFPRITAVFITGWRIFRKKKINFLDVRHHFVAEVGAQ